MPAPEDYGAFVRLSAYSVLIGRFFGPGLRSFALRSIDVSFERAYPDGVSTS